MDDADALAALAQSLDGRGYKAYNALEGSWRFPHFALHMDHVQGDPFAAPSRLRAVVEPAVAALPAEVLSSPSRRVGVACRLARAFARRAGEAASSRGSGRSGEIRMDAPGQEVLLQTAVQVADDGTVEARFTVGLPARGRRVLGREASELLTRDVAAVVEESLPASAHRAADLVAHAEANEDADALRAALAPRGLVAFVADGAVLPRRSGVDDRPLEGKAVVPFRSPDGLRVTIPLPNAGAVTGMGIPAGVTLVVGGGFHGKSTLLRALERGVYNHRPGDGRERVVSDARAVKVRAEDGRSVAGVDISPFIDGLPLGADTRAFRTREASGSTSQAAAVVEALEAGATSLLVDEDTAAANFMVRDRRMQALVPKEGEPITPFVDRVRDLHRVLGVSTVLVAGGSGDWLDVADTVVGMRDYRPLDLTERARAVARELPTGRAAETGGAPRAPRPRVPLPASVDLRRGRRAVSVKVRDVHTILLGTETLDLSGVEQLVSWPQAHAVGRALALARERFMDGERTLPEILDGVLETVEREGLDALDWRDKPGDLAWFRRFELAAALNRLRTLEVAEAPDSGG